MSDHELLHDYARAQSQPSFTALVNRHLNLVYSAALRQVRSPQLAEEISQSVLLELSRHAADFPKAQPLAAWLYAVTRRTAIDVIRRESRRLIRETTAAEIAAMKTPSETWPKVEARLDEAMETLNATERTAIVLRFFENQSLRDVGTALGLSEDTAQKRISRALDRLRASFATCGVAVSTATLATDLSAHAVQIAPTILGAHIAASATGTVATLGTGHIASLAMTTLEKTLLTAGLTLALAGVVFELTTLSAHRSDLTSIRQNNAKLLADSQRVQAQIDDATRRTSEARQRLSARSSAEDSPSDVALKALMSAWLDRLARLRRVAAEHPELLIPEFELLTEDDWFNASRNIPPQFESNYRVLLSVIRSAAETNFMQRLRPALQAYLAANAGVLPTDTHQLAPFFHPSVPSATLDRYKMAARGKFSALSGAERNALIEQNSPVDWEEDRVYRIGLSGNFPTNAFVYAANRALAAFKSANNGASPTSTEQLRPYLPAAIDPIRLTQYLANPPPSEAQIRRR